MTGSSFPWICCQLGAREHYAIPRALQQMGQLHSLVTDAWVSPQSTFNFLPQKLLKPLRDRFHQDLAEATIYASTGSLLQFEVGHRLRQTDAWKRIISRNLWFQRFAKQRLEAIDKQLEIKGIRPTLFCYSYAALELLRFAKAKGWCTVLDQIDPGPVEEAIVLKEQLVHPALAPDWHPAPDGYWQNWREECSLADLILVNSSWSSQALQQTGVSPRKIRIVPLAYSSPDAAKNFVRRYPVTFSWERPLRVLFLGQVILRKGIAALLDAVKHSQHLPIEFWIIGSQGITPPPEATTWHNLKWIGSVPRSAVADYYQQADVFLFPTLSDGFGLTQLEAQSWKLPLIVSRFCGEVVKDQVNGMVLPEVSGEAIIQALQVCLKHPRQLEAFSQMSISSNLFSLRQLQSHLQTLSYALV